MPADTYSLTFAQLKLAARHAIGKSVDAGQLQDNGRIVNESLQRLVKAHNWSWRHKVVFLDSLADSHYLEALPADYDGAVTIHVKGGSTDPQALNEIKPIYASQRERDHGTYRYVEDNNAQSGGSFEATKSIWVVPKPPSAVTDWAMLVYLRRCKAMSADTDRPDIPWQLSALLKQMVRAQALMEDRPGTPEAQAEEEKAVAMLNACIADDPTRRSNVPTNIPAR
jgi:hypothetical protein